MTSLNKNTEKEDTTKEYRDMRKASGFSFTSKAPTSTAPIIPNE